MKSQELDRFAHCRVVRHPDEIKVYLRDEQVGQCSFGDFERVFGSNPRKLLILVAKDRKEVSTRLANALSSANRGRPIKVWLDDERPAPAGWRRVRTAQACIDVLKGERVTHLSLDHDLGTTDHSGDTGYTVLSWMEREVERRGYVPPAVIELLTANPVGRVQMQAALNSIRAMAAVNAERKGIES